jgi:diphthamide biosynthesis methyltransferase
LYANYFIYIAKIYAERMTSIGISTQMDKLSGNKTKKIIALDRFFYYVKF